MNFAPTILSVPRDVHVRKVDLALELQILSYYEDCRNGNGRDVATDNQIDPVSA
jgi:redox-sensing transcriptional repressor